MENNYISRLEHNEYVKRMEDEHRRINHRLEKCEQISEQIGADSVHYVSVEGITDVMTNLCKKACEGKNECEHSFCMACFTGDYPDVRDRASIISENQEEKLLSLSYGDSGVNIDIL